MSGSARFTIGYTSETQTPALGTSDYLFLLLSGDSPMLPAVRHRLDAVQLIVVGRGDERCALLDREDGADRLTLQLADRRVSQVHAKLARGMGSWIVDDAGSRNGTFINGKPITRELLTDGDLLEVGRSFFLYRRELPEFDDTVTLPGIVTVSPVFSDVLAKLAQVGDSTTPVLLLGESGTGKEVLARAVHTLSRRSGAMVAVNCGALPETLVEATLFGHKKGAFTGAIDEKPGLVRAAEGGTLFLDEIGDLPLQSQAALLRVLEEREVTPVGGTKPVKVNFRLVAATNRPLTTLVKDGGFREDLFARVAGFTVYIPALRDRREDIGALVAALLAESADPRVRGAMFTNAAMRTIFTYDWPLNVRELRQCVETTALLAHPGPIDAEHLPASLTRGPTQPTPQAQELSEDDQALCEQLRSLLSNNGGNISAVARLLGKNRKQVQRWMSRFGLR